MSHLVEYYMCVHWVEDDINKLLLAYAKGIVVLVQILP